MTEPRNFDWAQLAQDCRAFVDVYAVASASDTILGSFLGRILRTAGATIPAPPDPGQAREPDVLEPDRGDGKARGVTRAWAATHPEGPSDFDDGPGPSGETGQARETAKRGCQAEIWPHWANSWVTCGYAVRNGKCVKYGHEQDTEPPGDTVQAPESPTDSTPKAGRGGSSEAETATGGRAPDVAATALRDAARLLDMVADARDVYLEGMKEDSESAVAIETFGSGIRSAARVLRAEPHTVELLVPTWRYLGELAELDLRVRALAGTDTTPDRLAWISEAGETAAAQRQARYQETACARRPAEETPDV